MQGEAPNLLRRARHRVDFQSKLTPRQRQEFKALFDVYDKDKSGSISISELNTVLKKLGYNFTPENLVHVMRIVDDNGDGELNFNEFLGFYDFLFYLHSIFNEVDADKSGFLDRRELAQLLVKSGYKFSPRQVELLYRMCDNDNSGKIEVAEFFGLTFFLILCQIIFAAADADGSDSVELKELDKVLKDLGLPMPPEQVKKVFDALDVQKKGSLKFEEFIELIFLLKYLGS